MTDYIDTDTVYNSGSKDWRKVRCERHKKACKKCKYSHCSIDCKNCKINQFDSILLCPCLNFDASPKGSRCAHFEKEAKQ